jgi:peroxiredoxin
MTQRIKWSVLALLLLPWLALAAGSGAVLKDFSGRDRNVNEYIGRGQWTVVAVWSADCPICKRDIVHMVFFHDEHRKRDAAVLGLSVDGFANLKKAQGFVDDQKLNFPNLIGDPHDAARLSGTPFRGTPTYYIFSPEGKFMTHRVGPVTQDQMEAIIKSLKAERSGKKKPG